LAKGSGSAVTYIEYIWIVGVIFVMMVLAIAIRDVIRERASRKLRRQFFNDCQRQLEQDHNWLVDDFVIEINNKRQPIIVYQELQ
jgi:hypothetical protein